MQLVLAVGNKEIDRIDLRADLTNDKEYIEAQQRLLLVKHELTLLAYLEGYTFYLSASSEIGRKVK